MTPDNGGHWRNRVIGISLTEQSDVCVRVHMRACRSRACTNLLARFDSASRCSTTGVEFFFFFLFLNDRIVSTTQIFQIGSIIAWAVLQLQFICIQSFTINRNFNWKITPRIRVSFRITFHSPLFKLSLIKNALRRITLNKYPCVWIISWVKLIGFSFQFRPIINANYYIISFA